MPRIVIDSQFIMFFYSNDHLPVHVHVKLGERSCRVEVKTLEVTKNKGFTSKQLKLVKLIVSDNEETIRRAWNEHFSKKKDD